eukprot:g8754.t2
MAVATPSSVTVVTGDAAGSGEKRKGKIEAEIERKNREQPASGAKAASSGGEGDPRKELATSRARPRLPQSKLETHRLWHEDGLSVDAVAEVRCNKASTVRGYLADCIEAGLPYEWSRLGVDSSKEDTIVRALLAATGNHPPAPAGLIPSTAPATCSNNEDEAAGISSAVSSDTNGRNPVASNACGSKPRTLSLAAAGAPVGDPEAANVSCAPACAATGGPDDCRGGPASAAGAVGTVEGHRRWRRVGDGSCSANAAMEGGILPAADVDGEGRLISENGVHGESIHCGSNRSDDDGKGAGSAARAVGAAGGADGAEGARGMSEMGRWDSVRLKEVKELAPSAEYWEIRMVLAKLKAGSSGCSS